MILIEKKSRYLGREGRERERERETDREREGGGGGERVKWSVLVDEN